MHRFTLYTHPYSRGTNVVWMLKECGAQYDVKLIPFGEAMKSADYLAVNPMGKVPALKGTLEDNVERLLSKSSYKAEEIINALERKLEDLKAANAKFQK